MSSKSSLLSIEGGKKGGLIYMKGPSDHLMNINLRVPVKRYLIQDNERGTETNRQCMKVQHGATWNKTGNS